MKNKNILLLNEKDIRRKIERIAYEIIENNYEEDELIIAGIQENGYRFAKKLVQVLKKIAPFTITFTSLVLNKKTPAREAITLQVEKEQLNNKVVILVDDVANTGKTLFFAVKPLLDCSPKKVQVVVLVDRKHKMFPVCADYVGLSLSTTMKEHIRVEIAGSKEEAVYLS